MLPKNKRPTEAELELLKVLWEQGPSTVRQVWEAVSAKRPLGYTTVLKMLQIMQEKGLVRRDDRERAHVYEAKAEREATLRGMVDDLLQQAFDGSMRQLLVAAFEGTRVTAQERRELQKLLQMLEENEHHERSDKSDR